MPLIGCFQRPFMSLRAGSWAVSPAATASLRCWSWALITSSAVSPLNALSHGPPICLHVIVFMSVHLLDANHVAGGVSYGAVARAPRLVGGLLHDLDVLGLDPVEGDRKSVV